MYLILVDVLGSRSFCQSMFLPIDNIEVNVLVVDVLELNVFGARQKIETDYWQGSCMGRHRKELKNISQDGKNPFTIV